MALENITNLQLHPIGIIYDFALGEHCGYPRMMDREGGQSIDFEEHWTGNSIFENEWQSFRTRQSRDLELKTVAHTYATPGRYTVAIKVIDIFGNDTMTLVPVNAG